MIFSLFQEKKLLQIKFKNEYITELNNELINKINSLLEERLDLFGEASIQISELPEIKDIDILRQFYILSNWNFYELDFALYFSVNRQE